MTLLLHFHIKNVSCWLALARKWGPGWCCCDMRLLKANLEQRRLRTIQKIPTIRMKEKCFSQVLWWSSKTSLWLTLQTDMSLLDNFDSNFINAILMHTMSGNILIPSLLLLVMAFQNNFQGKQMMFLL